MRILMLTHDQHIDRRILQEAKTLSENFDVKILILPNATIDYGFEEFIIRLPRNRSKQKLFLHTFARYVRRFIHSSKVIKIFRFIFWKFYARNPEDYFLNLFLPFAREIPHDIVVAHDLPMLPIGSVLSQIHNTKLVYDSHELFVESGVHSKLEKKFWINIEKKYLPTCDLVITVNKSISEVLSKRYQYNPIYIISNAIDQQDIGKNNTISLRNKFDISTNEIILVYQGNLSINRFIENIILALNYLKNEYPVRLIIIGDGPRKKILYNLVKKNALTKHVHFLGFISGNYFLEYTAQADFGIISYQPTCLNAYYATPNKLYEYIAAGVPIISTDLPEISELIRNYNIGITGKTSSPYEFYLLIKQGIPYLSKYKENVIEAKRSISWKNESKKLNELYLKLKDNSPKKIVE